MPPRLYINSQLWTERLPAAAQIAPPPTCPDPMRVKFPRNRQLSKQTAGEDDPSGLYMYTAPPLCCAELLSKMHDTTCNAEVVA